MKNPLLEIKNLSVDFYSDGGVTPAVKNVSIKVEPGRAMGIVGESGSGKSVTCLSIMQLIASPPGHVKEGEIWFNSSFGMVDLLNTSKKDIRRYRGNEIGMIFQEPMSSLNPVLRCGQQVLEAIRLHKKLSYKKAKKRVIELFTEVEIKDPEKAFRSYPHELSGGQQQRVMIALAVSCNPRLLIADEPTTALDVTVQKSIIDLMKKLQVTHNMGIIFITHDLGVIAEICDDVTVMYQGDVVEQGPLEKIFKNPEHPYTKGLLACRPPLSKRYEKLLTVSDFISGNAEGKEVDKAMGLVEITKEQRKEHLEVIYSKTPIVRVEGLKKYYSNKGDKKNPLTKAVDDVSFEIYPGETLGLVGESGCGKSTLGRTILRLIPATDGAVFYKGENVLGMSKKELRAVRKKIQIIFQDPYSSLNPRQTVGAAIIEPMKVHGLWSNRKERKEKVLELLEKVGLERKHYDRFPHEFSGGQRQRICIARTLAVEPEFIVCDESVSALDVSVQAQVLNLLNDLKKEFGFTFIFISHDLSVVKFMSDRMIVMNDGRIQEMGEADDIYENPMTDYTKKLISSIPKGIEDESLALN